MATGYLLATLSIIVLLGTGLRLLVSSEPLWLDELHTSWVVGSGMDQVAWRAKIGNQSPGYFWLVHRFQSLAGFTAFSLRLPSILAGIALLILAPWLVYRWTRSTSASIVSGILVAIDPTFIFYSTEARPYVFVQLFGLLQFAAFHEFTRADRNGATIQQATLLTGFSVALFYLHYTAAWLLVAEAVYLAMRWRRFTESPPQRWLGVCIAVGLISCIPAFLHLAEVFGRRSYWSDVSSPELLLRVAGTRALQYVGLPGLAAAAVCWSTGGFPKSPGRDVLALAIVVAVVPVAGCLGAAVLNIAPLALDRYSLVGLIAYPITTALFLSMAVDRLRTPIAQLMLLASVIVATTVGFNSFFCDSIMRGRVIALRYENWRGPIDEINRDESKLEHPVFLFSNIIEDVDAYRNDDPQFQEYLRFPVTGLYRVDQHDRSVIAGPTITREHFQEEHLESIRQQGGAWLIIRGEPMLVAAIVQQIGKQIPSIEARTFASPDNQVILVSIDD